MTFDGKLLARAHERLEQRREDNQAEQQRRQARVYMYLPEIEDIDRRLRGHMVELVRLTIAKRPDMAQQLERLKDENLTLQARRAELLNAKGFGTEYLDEIFTCEKCRDTGYCEGSACSCLVELYNKELTKELGVLLKTGNESFERFDLSLYPEADENGARPRAVMEVIRDHCRRFAESFPEVSGSLLMQGAPGLGKTFLSACIARVVAARGYSVCYDTATSALEAFEIQKFSRSTEDAEAASVRVRRMLECDLMILDDLGTEFATPAAVSALYTLINTRIVNDKRTIISTNLSDSELSSRYNGQIYSRIKGEYKTLPFAGRDIRQIKKTQK